MLTLFSHFGLSFSSDDVRRHFGCRELSARTGPGARTGPERYVRRSRCQIIGFTTLDLVNHVNRSAIFAAAASPGKNCRGRAGKIAASPPVYRLERDQTGPFASPRRPPADPASLARRSASRPPAAGPRRTPRAGRPARSIGGLQIRPRRRFRQDAPGRRRVVASGSGQSRRRNRRDRGRSGTARDHERAGDRREPGPKECVRIIGASSPAGDGRDGRPLHGQGLSVVDFKARDLLPPALGSRARRAAASASAQVARASAVSQPPLLKVERIPAQPEPAPRDQQQQDDRPSHDQPAPPASAFARAQPGPGHG